MISDDLREKLNGLPASPGVYLFLGEGGRVLYVGKASSLKSRVRSYFQAGSSDSRYFIPWLEETIRDLTTYVVDSEKEAALLENQLIKEHQPQFNVKLRDDKEFLSLRLDKNDPWPRLEVVRRPVADGARYFGPFHSASGARKTLRVVNRYFQLRTCTDADMRSRKRPCLQHQIKRCPAPCVFEVDKAQYGAQVDGVALFLDGRHGELVEDLNGRMRSASERMDYELAAVYRDQIEAVERVLEGQRIATVKTVDQDVLGFHRQADQAEMAVVRLRRGRIVAVETFALRDVAVPDSEAVASFLARHYVQGTYVPQEISLPIAVEAMAGLEDLLGDLRGSRVKLAVPQRGERLKLVQLANENASHAFQEKRRAKENVDSRLKEVQQRLRLPSLPRRIECIDVSHTGGEHTVAAIVALLDGVPDKTRYRSFHVREVSGGDDYGAMREVLSRRFTDKKATKETWSHPDLLVVDGGKGQLNVALSVMEGLGLELPVVALAKEKEREGSDRVVDRVFIPGAKNAIALRDTSPALQMLALARDEAHRSSNLLRERSMRKSRIQSELDGVPGVGPKTRVRLLKHFGSVDGIRAASSEQLGDAGATKAQAEAIAKHLGANIDGVPTDGDEGSAIDNAFAAVHPEPSDD